MQDGYSGATGKPTLNATSSDYAKLFVLAKRLVREWQNEPDVEWESQHQLVGAGTVTATDTFDLDEDVWSISQRDGEYVYVKTISGQYIPYLLVSHADLDKHKYGNAVAFNGTQLTFSRAFTSDEQAFGGSISVPAFIKQDDITSVNDDVPIDNPDWLSAALSARYALTKSNLNYLYDDLLAIQNQLMQKMKENNERVSDSIPDMPFFSNVGGSEYAYSFTS